MKRHKNKEHKITIPTKTYTSKRITCKFCDKRFNKNTTYEKHMGESHPQIVKGKETEKNQIDPPNSNQIINKNEVHPRVTRQRSKKNSS